MIGHLNSAKLIFALSAILFSQIWLEDAAAAPHPLPTQCDNDNTTVARVVALEQVYFYNRFGAFNPGGMLFALERDVVQSSDDDSDGIVDGAPIALSETASNVHLAGHVRLRDGKRPRPLVLRVNEENCLRVTFTNLLSPIRDGEKFYKDPETGRLVSLESEEPATRHASLHANGLEIAGSIASDGSNVGFNENSLTAPGETKTYTWFARKEGGYLLYSMGAMAGGEGDGGQLGLGLFGSINVEPKGSVWYRSQIDENDFRTVTTGKTAIGTPTIDYVKRGSDGLPILSMQDGNEIIRSDLNAIIDPIEGENCESVKGPSSSCGRPFREFTVIFHDEITAVQAFSELDKEDSPIHSLRDGMGINYGAAGLGAMVLANRRGIGPAKNCVECKLEEFFLTSWAMGDPALVVERDDENRALRALYPDDPSNVHHSYLGDPVRFRNLHAGPKETHVFHLHAHQWTQDWHDDNALYLDSQTISPGASFTYEVQYGGSGNRNHTVGDSIFHCHLYPHFAQGMWELWRTHDVLEAGTKDRWLPDGEITGGTPNPAIVPLPGEPMPPMPTAQFKGYPFYIAGIPGHRPPQAPNDIDPAAYANNGQGTLMRHVVIGGERQTGHDLFGKNSAGQPTEMEHKYFDTTVPEDLPMGQANRIAARVRAENASPQLLALAAKLTKALIVQLPLDGTPAEKRAMNFHAGKAPGAVKIDAENTGYHIPLVGYPSCRPDGTCDSPASRVLFAVNGYDPKPGAPYADPCPAKYFTGTKDQLNDPTHWHKMAPDRLYRAAYIQFDMPVNKHGWHDPQARMIVLEEDAKATLDHTRAPEPFFFRANSGECIRFEATNLIPSNLNLDDFQVFSPTDTIGQHIHLVKFDVTASDGSGNGWNYEDGTFSPDEIRERTIAYNAFMGQALLKPLTHRLFRPGGPMAGDPRGQCPQTLPADPDAAEALLAEHPWCGAQTTVQRWWADPLLNQDGKDRTIRTVFTHDHFGPSSHQQHGFYAGLVIEPKDSRWESLAGTVMGGRRPDGTLIEVRKDGGPTSYAANILNPLKPNDKTLNLREYNIAVADFSLLYTAPPHNRPISPPGRLDHDLPQVTLNSRIPHPEGISVSDPGGQLMNYRNEPLPLRLAAENAKGEWNLRNYVAGEAQRCEAALEDSTGVGPSELDAVCATSDTGAKAACQRRYISMRCNRADLANVFSSFTHADQEREIQQAISADNRTYDTRRIFMNNYLGMANSVRSACTDSSTKICAEPAAARRRGDPATPILTAKENDRVLVRLIQGAQEENHIFFMNGVRWQAEPGSPNTGYRAAQHIGISEHFEFDFDVRKPRPDAPADLLYGTTATDNLWDGQWGLLRIYGNSWPANLKPLPWNQGIPGPAPVDGDICPSDPDNRHVRHFDIEAWHVADLLNAVAGAGAQYYSKRARVSDPAAIVYVLTGERFDGTEVPGFVSEKTLIASGKQIEPLILRAKAGDCIEVNLVNKLTTKAEDLADPATWSWNMVPPITPSFNFNQVRRSTSIGLHPQLLSVEPQANDGSIVGRNTGSIAAACSGEAGEICQDSGQQPTAAQYIWNNTIKYTWYAGEYSKPPGEDTPQYRAMEFGVVGLQNFADTIKGASHGTIGALIIEPADASWTTDCQKSPQPINCLNASATVVHKNGQESFREFVVIYQNDVSLRYKGEALANLRNGDDSEDSGQKAFNYKFEPLWARLKANPAADPETMMDYDYAEALSSRSHGDPETPLFIAKAGDKVRVRVLEPAGHPRNSGFEISGHDWVNYPWVNASTEQAYDPGPQNRVGVVNGMGPGRTQNILLESAGGRAKIAGDYLYRSHEGFAFSGGQWGIMRVLDCANVPAEIPAEQRQLVCP